MTHWNKIRNAALAAPRDERKDPRYETLINEPLKDQLYSVILSDLQGIISPRTVQPRIYCMENGEVKWGQKGTPYTTYANEEHYKNNIRNFPIHSYAIPIDYYNQIEDTD